MSARREPFWQSIRGTGMLGIACVAVALGAAFGYWAWTLRQADEKSVAHATWVLAALTGVLAVGVPLAIRGATEESKQFYEQERVRFYAQLDSIYLEIQKLIIQYPFLGNPNAPRDGDQEIQYRAFAFIVWNFIESIHDYTNEEMDLAKHDRKEDSLVHATWECIMKHEGMLHAEWFANKENEGKFKHAFRKNMMRDLTAWGVVEPQAGNWQRSGMRN